MANDGELPRVFLGSSREGIELAKLLSAVLNRYAVVKPWYDVFRPNYGNLENLLREISTSDFAVFVWSPDDKAEIRGVESFVIRDNLVFEFGLFLGKLGRERVYAIVPEHQEGLRLLTDLHGVSLSRNDQSACEQPGRGCEKICFLDGIRLD